MCILIGHRVVPSIAPENSLISLDIAKKNNFKWIETDVILTKDKIPIIFHDRTLDRLTHYKGIIKDMNYKELKNIDIGSKYSSEFLKEKIPLLTQFIKKCSDLSLNVFLELKNHDYDEIEFVSIVINSIKFYKDISIILCSYSRKIIQVINKFYPNYQKSLIIDDIPYDWYDFVKINNCYSLNTNYSVSNNNLLDIKECVSKIPIYCHVVNNWEDYKELKNIGVKGIITDNLKN
jgi:glycerophosphoryl diester phosphodiesterase